MHKSETARKQITDLMQDIDAEVGPPGVELRDPLADEGEGRHDEHGPEPNVSDAQRSAAAVAERGEVGGDLDRLAQAHLVAQDAAAPLAVQLPQPLERRLLELVQAAPHGLGHSQRRLQRDVPVVVDDEAPGEQVDGRVARVRLAHCFGHGLHVLELLALRLLQPVRNERHSTQTGVDFRACTKYLLLFPN
jgi:hypothetical protein